MEQELRVRRYNEELSGVNVTVDICYPDVCKDQVNIFAAVEPAKKSKMADIYPLPKEVLLIESFWKSGLLHGVYIVIGNLTADGTNHPHATFFWKEGRVWRNDKPLSKLQPFIAAVVAAHTHVIKCGED